MRDGNEIVCRVQTDLGIETPLYSLCSGLPSLRMGRTNSKTACSHPSGWRPAHHNHVPIGCHSSALSLTLPTCFREFHRACPARDVPG